ncbi:MAG: A-macroglobulin complement component [Verrucomicrobiaceae bacterium]|nr:A-macroglobulin complement component [Verrucomicrobiaceae bacterium]
MTSKAKQSWQPQNGQAAVLPFSRFTCSFALLVISLFTFHLPLIPSSAAEPPPTISPQVKQSIDRAVRWLLPQQKSSGYFSEQKEQQVKRGEIPQNSAAMTSLAIMGLTSIGNMPGDPTPEGQAVAKALKFMVDNVTPDENGYLGKNDRSRMYGHGIMSLMIMEMLGMSQDEEVDRKLRKMAEGAVKLILQSQKVPKSDSNRGGWRYEPQSSDADMSVSVWQLMSLRAAKNAGLAVPSDAISDAVAYIKRSYRSERDSLGNPRDMAAAFSYEPYGGRQTFSTTAAGLLSLLACGQYAAPETIGSSNFLLKSPPEINEPWFFYGNYYYAQSMYQRGGDYAATARRKTEDTLLKAQAGDGSWLPRNGNEKSQGPVYATSLALLSLSVYHHFLPIYQK